MVERFDECIYNKMDDDDFSDYDFYYLEDFVDDNFDFFLMKGLDVM